MFIVSHCTEIVWIFSNILNTFEDVVVLADDPSEEREIMLWPREMFILAFILMNSIMWKK